MKVNVQQPVQDFEGKEIKDDKEQPITYRQIIGGLLQQFEPTDTGEVKSKIFEINTKLYATNEPDFTAEQITLINDRAGKYGSPLAVGRIKEFLEPISKSAD